MEKEHSNPVSGLMGETMDKIREMVDVNTVVGDPIQAGGVTILPISKVSVGFASGGTDLDLKKQEKSGNTAFGGAGEALRHGDRADRELPLHAADGVGGGAGVQLLRYLAGPLRAP